jgi:hypothetical protein
VKKPNGHANGQPIGEPFFPMRLRIFDSDQYRLGLTSFERDILDLMIRRHDDRTRDHIVSLGAREAADWYGYGKSQANHALQQLTKAGYITPVYTGHLVPVAGRPNIATKWRLNFLKPKVVANETRSPLPVRSTGQPSVRSTGHPSK